MKKPPFYFAVILVFALALQQASAQEQYEVPKLSNPDSWTMIMVPDTQAYVKYERNQGILELMTAWISENIKPMNIKLVFCTGDLVDQNDMLVAKQWDKKDINRVISKRQWSAVSKAFGRLDGKVPYVLAAGNHDFGYKNSEHRGSNYDVYFPADKNSKNLSILKAVAKNGSAHPTLENAAFEFTSPQNRKFLFMNVEYAPRDTVLQWAKGVVNQEKYKDHTVALLTHSYLAANNTHSKKENRLMLKEDGNGGKDIFEKLVQPSKNIQLVFSGHIAGGDSFGAHVAFKTDKNQAGKKVNQMTFNAQAMGGGWYGNGGDGWLRILEFLPDEKTVNVRTFSPFLALSPTTKHLAWSKIEINEFTFKLD